MWYLYEKYRKLCKLQNTLTRSSAKWKKYVHFPREKNRFKVYGYRLQGRGVTIPSRSYIPYPVPSYSPLYIPAKTRDAKKLWWRQGQNIVEVYRRNQLNNKTVQDSLLQEEWMSSLAKSFPWSRDWISRRQWQEISCGHSLTKCLLIIYDSLDICSINISWVSIMRQAYGIYQESLICQVMRKYQEFVYVLEKETENSRKNFKSILFP